MKKTILISMTTMLLLSLSSLSCAAQAGRAGAPAVVADQAAEESDGGLESVASRIAGRTFPSIFAPWNFGGDKQASAGDPGGREARITSIAQHDLYWNEWGSFGLKAGGDQPYIILSPQFTPQSIQNALKIRAALLARNPNLLILVNVHYYSVNGNGNWLPPESSYWIGDKKNNEYNSRKLDFYNPEFQDRIAALCSALVKTRVFDGILFDLWNSDWNDKQKYVQANAARVQLIQKVRAAIGEKALIIGNVTGRLPVNTAPYMNGMYMEGLGGDFFPDWHTAAYNMLWAQNHLHQPVITALEGWYLCQSPKCQGDPTAIQQQGRSNASRMRNITTLALVFSNGYVLFSDPDALPTPDHLHDWYPFWGKSLGKAVGPLAALDRPDLSGAYTRQFEKGEVVFNPPANHSVVVTFSEPHRSAATNATGTSFTVMAGDGDLFLAEGATGKAIGQ